jgi:hypothetical protein
MQIWTWRALSGQQKVIRQSEPKPYRILPTSASSISAVRALRAIHSYFILCHSRSMRLSSGPWGGPK